METLQVQHAIAALDGHVAHSCQTHVLGAAVIPQRLRSLRKLRARPASPDSTADSSAKRHCHDMEPSEAAAAEWLLGLSHSPHSSSFRDSEVSTEDEEFLPVSPLKRRPRSKALSPGKGGSQSANLDKRRSEDMDEDYEMESHSPTASSKAAKRLPGRCKCGKRVSASHPPCKSELMLLCERFCQRCGHLSKSGEPTRIHLNECAVALAVPRRRLYDITIVYEAVEIVKRTGKLAYVWRGLSHLPGLIEQLKREEEAGLPVADRKGHSMLPQHGERQTTHSLWALSRKFVRLLLTTKGPIQLTDAAEHLIGEPIAAKRQQTQVTVERRLYDIGSILATLNLIHRTYIDGKRQPAFSWNWNWENEQPASIPHSVLEPFEPSAAGDQVPLPAHCMQKLQDARPVSLSSVPKLLGLKTEEGVAAKDCAPSSMGSLRCSAAHQDGHRRPQFLTPLALTGVTSQEVSSITIPELPPPAPLVVQLHCSQSSSLIANVCKSSTACPQA